MNRLLLGPLVVTLFLVGCGPSSSPANAPTATPLPGTPRPACDEIATACHAHAEHGGLMSQCHEVGHDLKSTNEACAAKKSECLAVCK